MRVLLAVVVSVSMVAGLLTATVSAQEQPGPAPTPETSEAPASEAPPSEPPPANPEQPLEVYDEPVASIEEAVPPEERPAGPESVVEGSPFHRLYHTPDGGLSLEVFDEPVFFQDEQGRWEPIDLELQEVGDAFVPRRGPDRVARPARVNRPGHAVARGRSPHGDVEVVHTGSQGERPGRRTGNGRAVRYDDALTGGRDLIVAPTVDGFEEFVIVDSVEAGHAYEVEFRLPPHVQAQEVLGGVDFVHRDGEVIGTYGAGLAWDSAEQRAETPVQVRVLRQVGRNVTVQTSVDEAWFTAPERSFPITVDPIYEVGVYAGSTECMYATSPYYACDTYINSDNKSAGYWSSTHLRLGSNGAYEQGSTTTRADTRTYIKWATDSLGTGAYQYPVSYARINLDVYRGPTTSGVYQTFHVTRLTEPPDRSTTWNNPPAYNAYIQGSDSEYANGDLEFMITGLADAWLRGTRPNYGVRIFADAQNDLNSFREIYSANYGYSAGPRLYIRYAVPPSVPPSLVAQPGVRQVSASWGQPSSWGDAPSTTQSFEAQLSSGSTVVETQSLTRTTTSTTFSAPADDTLYTVRVRALNNAGASDWVQATTRTHAVPSAPRSVEATQSGEVVRVTWQPPSSDGRSPITTYWVRAYDSAGTYVGQRTCTVPCQAVDWPMSELTVGQSYVFRVVAINAVGKGAPADSAPVTVLPPVNEPPTATGPQPPNDADLSAPPATWSVRYDDPELTSGTVEFSLSSVSVDGAVTLMGTATSTSVVSGSRATVDTTALPTLANVVHGDYQWTAIPTDALGAQGTPLTSTFSVIEEARYHGHDIWAPWASGVNTALGNLVHSEADAEIVTVGPPLVLERTYNSRSTNEGAFGRGWSWTFGARWVGDDVGNIAIDWGDGRREVHRRRADGTYDAPGGLYTELRRRDGGGYTLTTKARSVWAFDSLGRLESITDANQRQVTLTYTSGTEVDLITDVTSGRFLDVDWESGRIRTVTTSPVSPTEPGLVWTYGYTNGLLTQVCSPRTLADGSAQCWTHDYDAQQLLERIVSPRGPDVLAVTYDGHRRIATRSDGEGNTTRYDYDGTTVFVTDPRGSGPRDPAYTTQLVHVLCV